MIQPRNTRYNNHREKGGKRKLSRYTKLNKNAHSSNNQSIIKSVAGHGSAQLSLPLTRNAETSDFVTNEHRGMNKRDRDRASAHHVGVVKRGESSHDLGGG